MYLGNREERSLNKSSFSVFWRKENLILPFAVNVMLNRGGNGKPLTASRRSAFGVFVVLNLTDLSF